MPTNHYFNIGPGIGSASEQRLFQSLTTETIKIGGADFIYLPKTIVNLDQLFKEDYVSSFEENYTIEMYIENYDNFLGAGALIGKFGFQLEEQLRLIVSKERFLETIVDQQFPVEGDLIYFPTSKHLFEIKFVDERGGMYPLGSRAHFTLVCDTFKHSHETFNTGTEVDNFVERFGDVGATGPNIDPFAKNYEIGDIATPVVNWDESNPFGNLG